MRHRLALFTFSIGLLMITGDAVMAQTPAATSAQSSPMTNRELRKQDREECTKQAAQQNIAKRNQAEFLRKCMADRHGQRKKKTSEDRRERRKMAAEEWAAVQEVRNRERHEQLDQQAAKRADCNKQANEQKLRLAQRRNFIKTCVAQ